MENCESCPSPLITLDFNYMMSSVIGPERGISEAEIEASLPLAKKAYDGVSSKRAAGSLRWADLPYSQSQVADDIEKAAKEIRASFNAFVVFGIGGSALGPIAVQQALNHLHYNELPDEKRAGPRLYVEDNIDPERMNALLDVIDVKRSCFNIITKSGETAETMSQYLIISDALKKAVGDGWQRHIVATTDQNKGILIEIAKKEGFRLFYVPDGVGGRFSELCPVGLLPAAVCGIDIRGLLSGAKCMDVRCRSGNPWENPALMQAVLQNLLIKRGINIHVAMPYADSLKYMADWFCQLWAESLGKKENNSKETVNAGQTPVKALGVTDQHSQLQLYTEGPFDKVITLFKVGAFRSHRTIPHGCPEHPSVAFLGGKALDQLLEAERQGTEYALCKARRLCQTIELPVVSALTIGQLIYFYELATAYMGEMLDINAFDQPGVEASKIASFAVLGNTGDKYIAMKNELETRPARNEKYIL